MKLIREFLKYESSGGILIFLAAILALCMKNAASHTIYDDLLALPVALQVGSFVLHKPLLLWINDGLMAIFFLLVGLEIKREIIEGHLSSVKHMTLPALAAAGGLIVPAVIYSCLNWDHAEAMRGWAIPAATDIAFALGVLSLLGKRVPETLKLCLLAIAIIDDLAAITIIALFYTAQLSWFFMGLALLITVILWIAHHKHVTAMSFYLIIGVVLWICVLKSGVHATLAGVLLALLIPFKPLHHADRSPAKWLEHVLHPWVAYGILPVFAFANAGVSLSALSITDFTHPIPLGITLGLLLGKPIGVVVSTVIGLQLKWCKLPRGVNWRQYGGMACLTGIGFTMSLLIGTLAFHDPATQNLVKLGVMTGSCLSGIAGFVCLWAADRNQTTPTDR